MKDCANQDDNQGTNGSLLRLDRLRVRTLQVCTYMATSDVPYQFIQPRAVMNLLRSQDSCALVDVRSREEFEEEHIQGSINIPLGEICRNIDQLSDYTEVVLVCTQGKRARRAACLLRDSPVDLFVLEGGITIWRHSNLPTESHRQAPTDEQKLYRIMAFGCLVSACIITSALPLAVPILTSLIVRDIKRDIEAPR